MVKCPRCGYDFDLNRSNKLRQIIDYLTDQNSVELKDLHNHFRKKWSCSSTVITNILKKLGRDRIIKIEKSIIYLTDEWILKQKKLH